MQTSQEDNVQWHAIKQNFLIAAHTEKAEFVHQRTK